MEGDSCIRQTKLDSLFLLLLLKILTPRDLTGPSQNFLLGQSRHTAPVLLAKSFLKLFEQLRANLVTAQALNLQQHSLAGIVL